MNSPLAVIARSVFFFVCLLTFQVELVLDLEETVPQKFANRAHVKKHVEYPNKDESKVFLERFTTQLFILVNAAKWRIVSTHIRQSQ